MDLFNVVIQPNFHHPHFTVYDTLRDEEPIERGDVSSSKRIDQWNVAILTAAAYWFVGGSILSLCKIEVRQ